MRTSAFYSVKENVYHNNSNCSAGNKVEVADRRNGTGNKDLCRECEKLNDNRR